MTHQRHTPIRQRLFLVLAMLVLTSSAIVGFPGQRTKITPDPDPGKNGFCKESLNLCSKRCMDFNPAQRDRTQNERAARNRARCMTICRNSYNACKS